MRLKSPYEVSKFGIGVYLEERRSVNFIRLFRDILASRCGCICFPVPHGKIGGKADVTYELLSRSFNGVDPVTIDVVFKPC